MLETDTRILRSAELELTFEPARGGKWRSLRDRRSGQEWFWRNPHLPERPICYGDSYIEKLDTGGWDEVFPSVSPCGDIPDHGDLVQLPWRIGTHTETRLAMSVDGRCRPFAFDRTVVLNGAEIRCDYRLENTGDRPFPWLWCAHPLLPLTPQTEIEAPGTFEVLNALGAAGKSPGARIGLNDLPWAADGWAVKLFSERGTVNEVSARQAGGSGLRISWDANRIPYLGLWINRGAWSGCGSAPYFNVGLEPAMLPVDILDEAEDPPVLEPGAVIRWHVDVAVLCTS